MQISASNDLFNLIDAKWIPVLYKNGHFAKVGIHKAFIDAGKICQIAASNPMDRVAILRFLMAVLMWCINDAKSSIQELVMNGSGITDDWLGRLSKHKAAFNLLGDSQRFYQNVSIIHKKPRPIADLLVEFPGEKSVNHLRHVVHDGSYGFCPACCTLGILRLSVWASANGSYPASINPGSGVYVIAEGRTLLQTLGANIPEANSQEDQVPWLGDESPKSPGAISRFAWRPRKLWLNVGNKEMGCANCGAMAVLITSLCNEGGWPTPTTDNQEFSKGVEEEFKKLGYSPKGKDSANKNARKVVKSASVIRNCRMDALRNACGQGELKSHTDQMTEIKYDSDVSEIARLSHMLIIKNDEKAIRDLTKSANEEEQKTLGDGGAHAKKFWVDDPQLLKDEEPISLPDLGKDVSTHSSKCWRETLRLRSRQDGALSVIGPVVNKFIFQDATAVYLNINSNKERDIVFMTSRCREILIDILRYVTKNSKQKHQEIVSLLTLLMPDVESKIVNRINKVDFASDDKDFLREVYATLVEQIVSSTTSGSPLRRNDARHHAQALLRKKIEELTEKSAHSTIEDSDVHPVTKPTRVRTKGAFK